MFERVHSTPNVTKSPPEWNLDTQIALDDLVFGGLGKVLCESPEY